jgi:hypothetical protein
MVRLLVQANLLLMSTHWIRCPSSADFPQPVFGRRPQSGVANTRSHPNPSQLQQLTPPSVGMQVALILCGAIEMTPPKEMNDVVCRLEITNAAG